MASKDYKIIKDYGLVAKRGEIELKFQLISWYGNKPKYDLRPWNGDYGMKGMVFEEESIMNLQQILHAFREAHPVVDDDNPVEVKVKDIVASLTSLPATDVNYQTSLREATAEDLQEAIRLMVDKPGNKTRISYCMKALNKLTKSKPEPKVKSASQPVEEKKAKIIMFPVDKPTIVELAETNEHHSLDECKAKLDKEREIFKDSDSQYVIDGLLEMAAVNQNFRNNIMRPDKSYTGAFEYFAEQARNGYCVKYGNVSYLDNNLALGLAIDYFNADEEAMKPKSNPKISDTKPKKRRRKGV